MVLCILTHDEKQHPFNPPLFAWLLVLSVLNGYLFNFINDRFFHYSSEGNNLNDFSPVPFL